MILAVRYSASIPWHAFPGALIGLGGYNGPYNQESNYADRNKTAAIFFNDEHHLFELLTHLSLRIHDEL
jgi:hypothetical protein